MRHNRFYSDIDLSSSIDYALKAAQKYCSEDYIVGRINRSNGRTDLRVKSYEASCYRSLGLLRSLYARGDSIESLRSVYLETCERLNMLEDSIQACGLEHPKIDLVYPLHISMLLALALAHALGEKPQVIGRNTRAIPSGCDLFVDRLLSVYDPKRPLADDIANKSVYKKLYAVFDAPAEKRPDMIARYVDEWTGYWCYPAAAVVAALNIDDSSFIDHEFYPTDLMKACAQYRGEPIILPPLKEPALPEPPKRSSKRKPELLAPWQPLFERMAATLPVKMVREKDKVVLLSK